MPKIFYTADTHFGHTGVVAMCNRPFSSIEEHDECLIATWNDAVAPEDTVWHLGDFAYRANRKWTRRVFERLNGTKHLVLGNHDRRYGDKLSETQNLPWASQHDLVEVTEADGTTLVLCHYSLEVWRNMRRGAVMLYGHSHGRLPGNAQKIDVGVDNMQYRPVEWHEIKARLAMLPSIRYQDKTDAVTLDEPTDDAGYGR